MVTICGIKQDFYWRDLNQKWAKNHAAVHKKYKKIVMPVPLRIETCIEIKVFTGQPAYSHDHILIIGGNNCILGLCHCGI